MHSPCSFWFKTGFIFASGDLKVRLSDFILRPRFNPLGVVFRIQKLWLG